MSDRNRRLQRKARQLARQENISYQQAITQLRDQRTPAAESPAQPAPAPAGVVWPYDAISDAFEQMPLREYNSLWNDHAQAIIDLRDYSRREGASDEQFAALLEDVTHFICAERDLQMDILQANGGRGVERAELVDRLNELADRLQNDPPVSSAEHDIADAGARVRRLDDDRVVAQYTTCATDSLSAFLQVPCSGDTPQCDATGLGVPGGGQISWPDAHGAITVFDDAGEPVETVRCDASQHGSYLRLMRIAEHQLQVWQLAVLGVHQLPYRAGADDDPLSVLIGATQAANGEVSLYVDGYVTGVGLDDSLRSIVCDGVNEPPRLLFRAGVLYEILYTFAPDGSIAGTSARPLLDLRAASPTAEDRGEIIRALGLDA
jgi:hypothetical protein